jgi:cytoplasmic iron level regulating protein YaaA (DUF328/UPF0246 family)
MLTLLSPAKKLDLEPAVNVITPTTPDLLDHTKILAKTAKKQTVADLQKLMKLSDNLAELNAARFKAFHLSGQSNSAKPAALTFNGNVYEGLDAASLDADDMAFAQDHVRILSGLYGLLKPMDSVQPYRLEMGVRMENPRGKNLYQFWGSILAQELNEDMAKHADKNVLNLASNEYVKAVDKKALSAPVIEAKFLNIKDGNARNLMYYAKRARGLMARWVIENRIDNAADLRGFDVENYKINTKESTENALVFTRKQPPPKGK